MALVRWPRVLTPRHLAQLIRQQKNPLAALHLFTVAPLRYPTYRHTAAVYSALIPLLVPSNLAAVADHMLLSASPVRDSASSAALSAAASPAAALALFRRLPLSNCAAWTQSFHTLLARLLASGDLAAAHQLLAEISHRGEVRVGVQSLNLLIASACANGRPDLAMEIFGEIRELCCYPDRETYRILMRGLCGAGMLNDAIHLLYSMLWRISQKGCDADVVVFRTLLDALCTEGRVCEAEQILGKILKKGLRTPRKRRSFRRPELSGRTLEETKRVIDEALVVGGVRSLASYGAMVEDLYEERKFEHADRMLDEMVERGFRPVVSMYEAKIAALCGDGRAEDGARVVEDMAERDCVPSVRAYNLVMGGLCMEGKSTRAVGYLDRMDRQVGCVASKETFEILVNGLCCEGRFLEAAQILERMLRRRYYPQSAIFNSVIRGLSSISRSYEAVLWLEEMVSQGKVPEVDVWSSLVPMICLGNHEIFLFCDGLAHEVSRC